MSHAKHLHPGSKLNQAVKALLGASQGIKVTSEMLKSMDQECTATFDPWKSSGQEPQKGMIKWSSTLFAHQNTWLQLQTLSTGNTTP